MRKGLIALGALLTLIFGVWGYFTLTATIHSDPKSVPTVTRSTPPPQSLSAVEKARQIVLTHLVGKNLPGLSVAVGVNNEVVWAEGFGYSDLRNRLPVAPEQRFRIGTASTVLTSVAAGLLLENNTLNLDDEIQKYVPAFPKKEWPVTVRELMAHTAGLRTDGGDEGPLFTKHCEKPSDALQYFADAPLLFQPGTGYRYSRYSWTVMSAAIETAANQPFLTFMRQHVFEPLGMHDTIPESQPTEVDDDFPLANAFREVIFDPRTARTSKPGKPNHPDDEVTPYFPRLAANPKYGLHLMRPLDYSCYAGSSVFLSTPSDLVRFGMAIDSGKLLQPATVKLLKTSQRLQSGEETGYGLGWDLETVTFAGKPARVIGHDGDSLGGMVSSFLTFPDYGIVVAVTSNISYADTFTLATKIAEPFATN